MTDFYQHQLTMKTSPIIQRYFCLFIHYLNCVVYLIYLKYMFYYAGCHLFLFCKAHLYRMKFKSTYAAMTRSHVAMLDAVRCFLNVQ